MSSSNTVDNKTVELQLKNENFEKNAKTSLSTLQRLEKALNFKGANGKIFDGIHKGAELGKAGVSGLTGAVSGLSNSLNAIKDVAAFSMIADSAIKAKNAVEQMVKSVTVDQISAGWGKYENMTQSMQTIMSATSYAFDDQAEQLKVVGEQMDKLNWFADETAYSLEHMTSSIGKFTANRVDLETSVSAIQGIGTWASKSGASVEDMNRAMYNLSQAISVGEVKLIDWKSVENANMATAEFKETAIQTAEALGTLTKVEDGLWKTLDGSEVSVTNFNEALQDGWFTSEVLLKSLNKYGDFSVKLNEYASEFRDGFGAAQIMDLIDQNKEGTIDWADAAEQSGVKLERLKEIITDLSQEQYEFGMAAFRAAQETKTWGEALDYTKEAVSSGWARTFQILFGEYTDAKKLWSNVSEFMYSIFVESGEKRNALLEDAFKQTDAISTGDWQALEKRNGFMNPMFEKALRHVAEQYDITADEMVSDHDMILKAVQDGQITAGMLKEAHDLMLSEPTHNESAETIKSIAAEDEAVQKFLDTLDGYSEEDLAKITFGDGKYAEGYEELEAGLDGIIKGLGLTQDQSNEAIEALKALGYFGGVATEGWEGYTDEQLKALGLSTMQINKFRQLQKEGMDFNAVLEEVGIDQTTGYQHFFNGLQNLMDGIVGLKDMISEEWSTFFPPLQSTSVHDWLVSFDEATEKAKTFMTESKTLRNVIRGVLSVVDLAVSNFRMLGEAVAMKGIFMVGGKILGMIGPFLKLTGVIAAGAAVFNFFKGILEGLGINWGKLGNGVSNITQKFVKWFKAMDPINRGLDWISKQGNKIGKSIRGWFGSFAKLPAANKGMTQLRQGFIRFQQGFSGHIKEGQTRLEEFNKKVEEMGGIRPDNFIDIFKLGKDELLDWLKTFPGVKTMMEGLGNLWKGLEYKLIEAGVPVHAIKDGFKTMFEIVKSGAKMAISSFNWLLDQADKLWKSFTNLPIVSNAVKNFGGAFKTVEKTISPFLKGLPERFDAFGKRMGEINKDGFKLANVPEMFQAFKEEILGYIANWDGFKAVKNAFKNFWKDLTTSVEGNEDVQKVLTPIKDFFEQLKETLSVIELPETFDDIPKFLESIKTAIMGIPSAEGGGWSDMIFNGIKYVLERIVDIAIFATSHWKLLLGIALVAFIFKKISGIFHDIHEYFNAMTKELKARAFLETAAGVVLLAAAVWIVVNTFKDMIELFGKGDSFVENMKHIAPGLIAIVVILGMMAKLFKTVGKMNTEGQSTAGMVWGVAAAVAAVWVVAHAFIDFANNLDTGNGFKANMEKIGPALIAMGSVILMMMGLFAIVGKMKPGTGTTWGIVAAISSLWVVAQAFKTLSKIDDTGINRGIKALLTVVGSMVALLVVASATKIEEGPILAIAGVIGAVSLALMALTYIATVKPDQMEMAINALIKVVLSISLLVGLTGGLKPAMGSLVMLSVIIAEIAIVIGLLDQFVGAEKTVKIADSLTKVFIGLGILMVAVAAVGMLGLGGILSGVIGMAAVIAGLGAVLVAVGYLVDKYGFEGYLDTGIQTVSKIVGVICEAITGIIQAIGQGLFGDRTPMQLLADDIAYMGETLGSDAFKQNVAKIGELNILSMSGVNMGLVAIMGGIFGAEGAIMSIVNVISECTVGKTAIGSLVDDIAYMAETLGGTEFAFNVKAIGALDLGDAFANGLAVAGMTAVFGAEGAIMSIFNIASEYTSGKTAIESLVDDISYLAETLGGDEFADNINKIGALNIEPAFENGLAVAGITAVFGVGGAISSIADTIIGFAKGEKDYSSMEQAMTDVATMATYLGSDSFAENINKIGNLKMPDAMTNMEDIALITGVFEAGGALTSIADAVIGFATGDTDFDSMTKAMEDIKTMAETLGGEEFSGYMTQLAETEVPTDKINDLQELIGDLNMDGLVSAIQGAFTKWLTDDDRTALENWANDVETLGDALKTWNTKMDEAGDLKVDSEAITAIQTAVESVGKTGGLLGAIQTFVTGEKDYEAFKEAAGTLGDAVNEFSTNLGEDTDIERIRKAQQLLAAISAFSKSFGEAAVVEFAEDFPDKLGQLSLMINSFVSDIQDAEAVGDIGAGVGPIAGAITNLSNINLDGDIMDEAAITAFGDHIKKLIEAIESTANVKTDGVSKVASAIEQLNSTEVGDSSGGAKQAAKMARDEAAAFASSGADAGSGFAENLEKSSGDVESAATGLLSAASDALKDVSAFTSAGGDMAEAVATGISEGISAVVSAASDMSVQALSAIDVSGSYNAGWDFVNGFANGIDLHIFVATQKARLMAEEAVRAVKAAINSHSPSKVTRELGGFFGEGFELGILDTVKDVSVAASSIGDSATGGLNRAVKDLNSMLTSELNDAPVIRPVLDLSEIQNGAGNITSMLSAVNVGDPFGRFDAINGSVELRRNRTSLDDVVTALGSVEQSTSNIRGGDTYNINGITYDDGTNVSEAVGLLIHAAMVERRG